MKRSILFMMAVSAIAVLSCTKEINNEIAPEKEKVTMSFDATLGAPTKVELGESNGKGGYKVLWSKGDEIAVFTSDPAAETGSTQKNEFVTDIQSASAQATFSGEIEAADVYYAVYPYESAVYWSEQYDNMTVELPAAQKANGIASGISIATAEGASLQFEHVTGYVKFTIPEEYADIKEVRFSGNNGEALAGQYYVYRDNGETANKFNTYSALYSTLVLIPTESEEVFTPGTYYFTSFPAELTKGLTLTFVNSSDKVASKSTDDTKPASIKAGDILNLGTISGLNFEVTTEKEVVFDFTDANSLGLTSAAEASSGVTVVDAIIIDNVTFTPGGPVDKIKLWTKTDMSTELRPYNTSSMAFSVPEGYVITKMVYTGGKIGDSLLIPDNGEYKNGMWIGKAQTITFNVTGTMNIVSIVLSVEKGTPKATQILTFDNDEYTIELGNDFTAPTVLGANTAVTYSSSKETVATVNSSTGAVEIVGAGTTIITVTAEEDGDYFKASASYTLNVTSSQVDEDKYYVKVTSDPADWSGTYLLAANGAEGFVVFNGMNAYGSNSYGTYKVVTENDGKILSTSDTDECQIKIAKSTNGYTIKFGEYYLGKPGGKNIIQANTQFNESSYEWTLTMSEEGVLTISSVGATGYNIKWNNSSGSYRFACYTTAQTDVLLYKL